MLYHKFPLKCAKVLSEFTKEHMSKYNGNIMYVDFVSLPDELVDTFNKEMEEYGLPPASRFISLKRKNNKKGDLIHIDSSARGELTHVSLIIPVEGMEDTAMYWVDGEYNLITKSTEKGVLYKEIEWTSETSYLDELQITTEPYVCKADIPHSAYSNDKGDYRTVLTIRFEGNPTLEEVVERRFKNQYCGDSGNHPVS